MSQIREALELLPCPFCEEQHEFDGRAYAASTAPLEVGETERLRDALSRVLQFVPAQLTGSDAQREIDHIHDLIAGRVEAWDETTPPPQPDAQALVTGYRAATGRHQGRPRLWAQSRAAGNAGRALMPSNAHYAAIAMAILFVVFQIAMSAPPHVRTSSSSDYAGCALPQNASARDTVDCRAWQVEKRRWHGCFNIDEASGECQ